MFVLLALLLQVQTAPSINVVARRQNKPFVGKAVHVSPGEETFFVANPLKKAVKLHFSCSDDYDDVYMKVPADYKGMVSITSEDNREIECVYISYE